MYRIYEREITLRDFWRYFDLDTRGIPEKERRMYIEEIKYTLRDIQDEDKFILELNTDNFEGTCWYVFTFRVHNCYFWEINSSENEELNKEGEKLYQEYLNKDQLELDI